jgi:hypothetical protein
MDTGFHKKLWGGEFHFVSWICGAARNRSFIVKMVLLCRMNEPNSLHGFHAAGTLAKIIEIQTLAP